MSRSRDPLSAPERNDWRLYASIEFVRQYTVLIAEVDALSRAHPETYSRHPKAKLLAAVLRLLTERIPRDPGAVEFRLGNTLGPKLRDRRRAIGITLEQDDARQLGLRRARGREGAPVERPLPVPVDRPRRGRESWPDTRQPIGPETEPAVPAV